MSGHELPYEWLTAPWLISDPGNAGTLKILDKGVAICQIKTAGAETRTIPAPVTLNRYLTVFLDTAGGACTVTVTGGVSGLTSFVLPSAGSFVTLMAISVAGTSVWVVADSNGVSSGIASVLGGNVTVNGQLLTTDGVASGDNRLVGGVVFAGVSTTDTITAAASANTFVTFAQTYTVKANTLKAGTVLRGKLFVDVINAAAGTATLTINLRLGGTSLVATTAVDPALNDWHSIDFEITSRVAPSGASALVGKFKWVTSTGGTNVAKEIILQSTNFATNGALILDCQAKWSAADATTTAQLEMFNVELIG
jgi:hypothetical protein